ncbi:TetR/AcrR family transcriptional regulator [Vibrio cholerae]|nr:TetR/AcrR family transcriptional regulator [Vibrio cholerae]EJB8380602.1 TetR/AcrR family transcriptional regulator [Vibrio cholerae]
MSKDLVKASRGRPKTLNRDHVVDVAMHAYWKEGVSAVSLNEICRRCEISKPGLYREFGSEDGLMKAVILAYQEQVLTRVLQMLNTETPFRETLDGLVSFVTEVSDNQEAPKGCLLVKMRESRMYVGEATREQIDLAHEQALTAFEEWVQRSKTKGEFTADMSSQFVSTYIDAQLSHALLQVARGEDSHIVKKMLILAFSMLG